MPLPGQALVLFALCSFSGVAAATETPLLDAVKQILEPSSIAPAAAPVPAPAPRLFDFVNLPALERTQVQTLPTTAPLPFVPWDEPARPPGTILPDRDGIVTCEHPFILTNAIRNNPWEVRTAPKIAYDEHPLLLQSVLIGSEAHATINGEFVKAGDTQLAPFKVVVIRSAEVVLQYDTFIFAIPEGRSVTVRTARFPTLTLP